MLVSVSFYFLACCLILSSMLVILARNMVYAALSLALTFFLCAGIWLLLYAEFLAMLLILLYVGAVLVLLLFVIMMLDVNMANLKQEVTRYMPVAILVAILQVISMGLVFASRYFSTQYYQPAPDYAAGDSNTAELGRVLYTEYLFQFELAGVILLVAIIAAIALTLRPPRNNKQSAAETQINVRSSDRVRLVKMASEKYD